MINTYPDRIEYVDANFLRHREDGPALEYISGPCKGWTGYYIHGKCHRAGGPAVINDNYDKFWWKNGKRHRLNAPAIIYPSGITEFWEFGIKTIYLK